MNINMNIKQHSRSFMTFFSYKTGACGVRVRNLQPSGHIPFSFMNREVRLEGGE